MRENLRKSGIDIIGDVPWRTHFCQFYQTREDLMDILIPYFKAGLENNEFCMWVTSQPLEVEEAKEALRKAVSDFDFYLKKGQIEIIPYTHWYIKKGIFDPEKVLNGWVEKLNQALATGYDGLRLTGDTSWLEKKDWNDFVDYEGKMDRVIGDYHMMALCTYSLDRCNAIEILDVVGNHQFALIKKEGKWEQIENSTRKRVEEELRRNEQHLQPELESVFSPAGEKANLELVDIINAQAIQSLLDDFYKFVPITMALLDLKGNVLAGVGWEEICTRFHRVHPETCKHCIESDTKLSAGVAPGEFKLYRCKSNMWDVATPIMVRGQHIGNIVSGQFFFEGEPLDYNFFRAQARKYGFNEEEYIAALEKVPRLSREAVDTCMSFLTKLAHMISQLSYSNIKMIQSLAERDALMDALRESSERLRQAQKVARTGTFEWNIQTGVNTWTQELEAMYGLLPGGFPGTEEAWEQLVYPDDRAEAIRQVNEALDTGSFEGEWRVVWPDGSVHWLYGRAFVFKDESGRPLKLIGINTDITERKQEEYRIRRYNRVLEGINSIFSNVVQAKTEEEVGNACLSVALEVTGSEFGFINEICTDGLLHDVAKSELGWERCFMYDKTGHRRPPGFFAVHGLYGSVINNEKGFFTNDPQSPPNSVGIPDGHPPITSFLGVPLVQDWKTIGLIAVANRESGYSIEQQEDLEAIAPTVVQALQRKKAEEALRLSDLYNRSLIEASLDPLVTIRPDGKIADVNDATETVTGCSRNELIGTDFSNNFTEPEEARKGYQQVFIQGEVRDYPLEIQHKDGHITPVLYNASVYKDKNGEVIGVFAAARDITERKRAEHHLSNELARATGLYEIYTRSSNLSDRELYDFALNQAVKITDSTIGFFHLVSEDEKEIVLTTWNQEALRSCTTGNKGHYPIEKAGNWVDCVRLKRPVVYNDFSSSPNQKGLPAGHATVKRFMSVPVIENGKVRIIFGVGNKVDEYDDRDVMQLQLVANELHKIMKLRRIEKEVRESEAFLRDIMENVSDAIFVRDREARITLANTAYYRLMGKSPEEVLNKTVSDFYPPEIARKLAEDDKRVMEAGKGTTLEERIFTSHGWRILQTVKAPYYDGQGNIIGLIGATRDITERKKAEEALKKAHENLEEKVKERTTQLKKAYNSLKESEKGLAEAQKMAHIGNWDWDLVTGEVYWSDEMYRIYGRNPQEPGATYSELLNYVRPDDRDYVDKSIKKGLREETKSGIDYRIILANGEERTVYARAEVIFDERNAPVRVKGITQDITERKKSEEKIQLLANIVESSNDAIGTISLDGIITSWNEEAEQVYGYSAEEILGKHTTILASPHLKKETNELRELIKQGKKIHHYETSRLRKDGKRIDVSITLSPVLDSHGKLTEISFISRDITERTRVEEKLRESEEKYRNIVETASEGIFIIDAEAIVTYANKKMADMLGYTLKEVSGIAIWDFISEDCKAIVKLNLEKRRQGINEIYELKLICKGGSSLWVLISAKSLFDKDGKFMGSINMLTDITKRKEAEEALANLEIARKQEIHHRIKNNLQVISSLLDLQADKFNNREDIKDSEVLEAFRESQDRVISMALIHEELYKGGGFDTLNFSSYIEKLAENLFQTYRLGTTDLSLNVDLEENTFFDVDVAVPLGIIVNELVSNSLKHAFQGRDKGAIQIKLRREGATECANNIQGSKKEGSKGTDFILTVSDNGRGMPENYNLQNSDTLGIQLVSILVGQLEGELELKRDSGTEFMIRFAVTEKQ